MSSRLSGAFALLASRTRKGKIIPLFFLILASFLAKMSGSITVPTHLRGSNLAGALRILDVLSPLYNPTTKSGRSPFGIRPWRSGSYCTSLPRKLLKTRSLGRRFLWSDGAELDLVGLPGKHS
ncbi:hypothetical protein ASPSYDRAFT_656931 [Aspergillus sydowii CBS 593.65]|uniref:Uncharacterized protein n=1 Tax=Aspergillus sydowii CBS 593.65 TaxID=1036612 RepID=A0A1L9TT68_9EURO|nr:uncharacterized protein ASPSYDRAFT_656931 [Aspergillus sydowii CBS 593.65]OJJ62629.1 hypothetical protein ASPSYDRAFT_656931 [Aspergillus sydowii CBS 593.65]